MLCLTPLAQAQGSGSSLDDIHKRWRLLPDSMTVGPYADLRAFAVERSVRNSQLRDCAWLYYFAEKEIAAMRQSKDASDRKTMAQEDRADILLGKTYELTDELIHCQGKRKAPNISGIGVGMGLGTILFGTVLVIANGMAR